MSFYEFNTVIYVIVWVLRLAIYHPYTLVAGDYFYI